MDACTKKHLLKMERKIADLESQLQSQQEAINHSVTFQELPLEQAARNVLKDSHNLTFRANISRKTLFELTSGQKQ